MKGFKPYNPKQIYFLPPSPTDWLPENHLAYFIDEVIDALDLRPFYQDYEGESRGQPPFDPAMMLKIITYGYCTGCFSSRRLEAKLREDLPFIYLAGGNRPDHRTIAAFRQRHRQRIHDLFVQVLQIAQKAGLVRLGHVALDGTKIKAHASRHKAMSYGRMKKVLPELEREVAELLRQAEETDAREEAEAPKKATSLPEELARREQRLARIRAAMAALEARAREEQEQESLAERSKAKKKKRDRSGPPPQDPPAPPEKAQYNFTDPESRIMLDNSTKAYVQAYNVQLAVDAKSQLIVGGLVSNQAADSPHLPKLVTEVKKNLGRFPREVSADAGYFSDDNLKFLYRHEIEGYLAFKKIKHGEKLPSAPRGRIPVNLSLKDRMRRKLCTKKGQQRYALRKITVEPVIGQIKRVLGFVQFLTRGLKNVMAEWDWVMLAHNLRKLWGKRAKLLPLLVR